MMVSLDFIPIIMDQIENVKNDKSLIQSEKEDILKSLEKQIEDRGKFEKKVSIANCLIFLFATIATIGEIIMWCINLHS
mgnify:CR=1 FL=1